MELAFFIILMTFIIFIALANLLDSKDSKITGNNNFWSPDNYDDGDHHHGGHGHNGGNDGSGCDGGGHH